jgi:hypothetical protein
VAEGTNQWAVQPFKIVKNEDGTKTYFLMSSDISRGIDIFTWTGPPNPNGSPPPAPAVAGKRASADRLEGTLPLGWIALLSLGGVLRRKRH